MVSPPAWNSCGKATSEFSSELKAQAGVAPAPPAIGFSWHPRLARCGLAAVPPIDPNIAAAPFAGRVAKRWLARPLLRHLPLVRQFVQLIQLRWAEAEERLLVGTLTLATGHDRNRPSKAPVAEVTRRRWRRGLIVRDGRGHARERVAERVMTPLSLQPFPLHQQIQFLLVPALRYPRYSKR